MEVVNHEVSGARQVPALSIGDPIEPWLIVIHYTANQSAAETVSWFQSPQSKVSAHLVVDLDGSITQMVPFNRRAAHAGTSRWRGKEGCNRFSIGIEIVNPGPLRRLSDGTFADLRGKRWEGKVVHAHHDNGNPEYELWAAYPEAQLSAVTEACRALVQAYPISEIVGHYDVAPTRKLDPGPAFPFQPVRALLAPRDDDGADVYAATTTLNVRSGPGVSHAPVAGSPLQPGQRVEVVAVNGSWWHVRTLDERVEGWAASHFLHCV
ncbi:MAG TPA: N-acetylmuramoyl-L-alanine amidase [Polyangiaceae bacterium]|nr:N-acetylmuramoyl-L-alanine amidase [Polyangiaceae bacterium]